MTTMFSNYMYIYIETFIVCLYYYRKGCQIIQIEDWNKQVMSYFATKNEAA